MLSSFGALILIYLISLKLLYGFDIGDRPLLIAGTLLVVVGIQLVSLGVIGEILSRTYYASSREKSYFIRWDSMTKSNFLFIFSVIAILFARVVFDVINQIEVHFDEAQYWVWSQNLSLSYLSKGPLVPLNRFF